MKAFSNAELDLLAGEVLPERAVLSTLMGGGDGDSYNNNNAGGGGHWGGSPGTTIVSNACQSDITRPDDGLLQLVGLHAQHHATSFTCAPGTAVSGH
ncbi:hypothetical protein [Actinomadura macrotermitis]|uniref:Uncharacterized protein n=1 Tax=Actinomadura macrotermitis TaxID=2585200 RepID=A0A7K0C2A3_9ACTN|nr:hypothetical protein [Actinomadura macrotermitis]MQY06954.1 hypothetical protein [Actinomadura macrotermitis]